MSERVIAFCGEADLRDAGGLYGNDSEDEDIRAEIFDSDAAVALLDRGAIEAGPAVVALSWFARHRARIRAEWLTADHPGPSRPATGVDKRMDKAIESIGGRASGQNSSMALSGQPRGNNTARTSFDGAPQYKETDVSMPSAAKNSAHFTARQCLQHLMGEMELVRASNRPMVITQPLPGQLTATCQESSLAQAAKRDVLDVRPLRASSTGQ